MPLRINIHHELRSTALSDKVEGSQRSRATEQARSGNWKPENLDLLYGYGRGGASGAPRTADQAEQPDGGIEAVDRDRRRSQIGHVQEVGCASRRLDHGVSVTDCCPDRVEPRRDRCQRIRRQFSRAGAYLVLRNLVGQPVHDKKELPRAVRDNEGRTQPRRKWRIRNRTETTIRAGWVGTTGHHLAADGKRRHVAAAGVADVKKAAVGSDGERRRARSDELGGFRGRPP